MRTEPGDERLARTARTAIWSDRSLRGAAIQVDVHDGIVVLEGRVDRAYQRRAAERAVSSLSGVHGISNRIAVDVEPNWVTIKGEIETALRRDRCIGGDRVRVELEGSRVVLRGVVATARARAEAERLARAVAGVTEVRNEIEVDKTIRALF